MEIIQDFANFIEVWYRIADTSEQKPVVQSAYNMLKSIEQTAPKDLLLCVDYKEKIEKVKAKLNSMN